MRRGNILIVEDQPDAALVLGKWLELLGHTVVGTTDRGEVAIKLAELHKPDLALVDITLAGSMDGTQLAGQLRTRFGIQCVFMSGNSDRGTVKRALGEGPMGYLVKPFDRQTLELSVQLALSQRLEQQQRTANDAERARADKAEAVAQLATRVAHEVNNLLSSISCNLHLLKSNASGSGEVDETVAEIASAVERGAILTGELLRTAHGRRKTPLHIEIAELVRSTASLNQAMLDARSNAPPDSPTTARTAQQPAAQRGRGEPILVVEHDRQLGDSVAELLMQAGYRVLAARSSAEALALAAREPVAVVLSDMLLPDSGGPALCRQLLERQPNAAVVYMASEPPERDAEPVSAGEPLPGIVYKPLQPQRLLEAVRRALAREPG